MADRPNLARLNPNYGRGVHHIDADVPDAAQIDAGIDRLFEAPDYQPPLLPRAAVRVNELTRDPNVNTNEVVAVIQEDPGLAVAILRRAQSPAYATKVPPRSLQDAASRLGLNAMRDLVWEVALKSKVFRHPACKSFMEDLGRHSIVTARVMRLVAGYTSLYDESAFLIGLLHDIGLVTAAHALAEDSRRRRAKLQINDYAFALHECHERCAERVTQAWDLPAETRLVIGSHHQPEMDGFVHPLIATCVVAEAIASALGVGVVLGSKRFDDPTPVALRRSLESLSIGEKQLETLIEKSRPLTTI